MRLAAVLAGLVLLVSPAFAQAPMPRVTTASGPVVGVTADGVSSFKGIPYAASPVGDLRWTPPKPAKAWTADLDAKNFGPACMQRQQSASDGEISEDCLKLSIWAPEKASKAPVIVWLHGGGHANGSSADKYTTGAGFASDGVILVGVNYRLGAFGYFTNPALGKAANFGLMDQIAALQWVKANIAAFGGDPANVTVMGESSGGEDVLALMVSPLAKGLFAHAIAESPGGGWWGPATAEDMRKASDEVAAKAGVTGAVTAKTLRALPAEALAKVPTFGLGLSIDGVTLTESPQAAFAAGHAAPVPLLIGTNSGEGSLLGEDAKPEGVFDNLGPEDIAKLKAIYKKDDHGAARDIFRDGFFAGPVLDIAKAHEKAGQAVYLYRFDFRMSVLRSRRPDAYHGSELPFVFSTLPPQAAAVEDSLMLGALHGCWAAFARTGQPTCQWAPSWGKGTASWMVFDEDLSDRPIGSTEVIDYLRSKLSPAAR
ncbi:MAG TPA: carboxylesterase family protein [Hyphomonadaceae bacterium]|jgi:para-nitrobenzyl esterase|nr:carboxylesterase family protein [Hyphomonadaceae bacterium]